MRYWNVPPEWAGETCAILAGGPSLNNVDLGALAGLRVLTINNSWQLYPNADVLYFCDSRWWRKHQFNVNTQFRGHYIVTMENDIPKVKCLRNAGMLGFSTDPCAICHGSNSGYQAINLACHFGVKRMLLFGYDGRVNGTRSHFHNDHDKSPSAYATVIKRAQWVEKFEYLVEPLESLGIEVINCSEGSAIPYWPVRDIKELVG